MIGEKNENVYTYGKTFNGYCFKDENAFINKKGVCYIAECLFKDNDFNPITITDEVLKNGIEDGSIETYDSIHEQVVSFLNTYFDDIDDIDNPDFIKYIEKCVFNEIDWECFQTRLYDIDIVSELEEFIKHIKQKDMEKVFILLIEWSYDYETDQDVIPFNTLEKAQAAMEQGYKSFDGNPKRFDDTDFSDRCAHFAEDGDWTRNHITWTIYERKIN